MPDFFVDTTEPDPTYPPHPGTERIAFRHARVVLDFYPAATSVRTAATSRGRVDLHAMHVHPLGPRPAPEVTPEAFAAAVVALAHDNRSLTWLHPQDDVAERLARTQLLALFGVLGVQAPASAVLVTGGDL